MEQLIELASTVLESPFMKFMVIGYMVLFCVILAAIVGVFVCVVREKRRFDERFKRW